MKFILGAGESTTWVDMRGRAGSLPLGIVVPGGGQAVLEAAFDDAAGGKSTAQTVDTFAASGLFKLPSPFPDFLRGRNSGLVAGVEFSFGQSERSDYKPVNLESEQYGGGQ